MKKIPKVYCASIATETNTFSPLKTNMKSFKETFFAKPNYHPKTPTLCSALFPLLRKRKSNGEIKLNAKRNVKRKLNAKENVKRKLNDEEKIKSQRIKLKTNKKS